MINGTEESLNATLSHNATTLPSLVSAEDYAYRHYIGMALALSGNLLISVSLSVQKKAHNRLGHDSDTLYCADKWWWLGMGLMGFGEIGNFMAYGFAPASMVAPLGSVAVIANTIIAALFLKEPLTMPSMLGVSLVIVGSVVLISFSVLDRAMLNSEEMISYLKAWPFLLYISIEMVLLLVLLYLKYRKDIEHMVVLLMLVAIIASVTIITAKALSTIVTEFILEGRFHIFNPIFWLSLLILPITTVTQIRFLNRAMQLYDVSNVVPVNFIFFTVSAILAGAMFYQEFYGVGFDRIFMFLFGCLQSFIGVCIITQQEKEKNVKNESRRDSTETPYSSIAGDSFHSDNHEGGSSPAAGPDSIRSHSSVELTQNGTGQLSSFQPLKKVEDNKPSSSNGFFSRFVRLVKSSESVTEVQPLFKRKKIPD